jgi:hypothetical protein
MKLIKKLICLIKGHKWDLTSLAVYENPICRRCKGFKVK